jgi:pyruvate dehydrogenase E2 component (dihydrolipoamide acetyltransferase)
MPQLSDTMSEGTLVKWHKKEGDPVRAGEEIADIETDKATMPMEAFESGTLAHIAAPEGQKVKVGELLAVIATAGEDAQDVKRKVKAGAASGAAAPGHAPAPTFVPAAQASSPADEADHPKLEAQRADARHQQAPAQPGEAPSGEAGRVRVSPLARRIAAEKGVDLSRLKGSGPAGRIVERDVLEALAAPAPSPAPAAVPAALPQSSKPAAAAPARAFAPLVARGKKEVVPMTKMRSAIAAALLRSKQTIPHYYEVMDVDLEAAVSLREKLNNMLERENIRLSIGDLVMKALTSALLRHPALNARFNSDKGEITRYGDVNLGIAVAIPDGLIVPVLRNADQLGLRELRLRSLNLIDRARAQRLRQEEQTESTFTITSLGSQGIRQFAAIINPPEVGILAVGAATKRPTVINNQCVPRMMMTLTLSADHRVVDGAVAAEFLATIKQILEEPGLMLV